MELRRLGRLQPLLVQVGVVLRIVIHNIVVAILDQDVGMVVAQIAVLGVHRVVHYVLCTANVEIGMGDMDILVRRLLYQIQLSDPAGAASLH